MANVKPRGRKNARAACIMHHQFSQESGLTLYWEWILLCFYPIRLRAVRPLLRDNSRAEKKQGLLRSTSSSSSLSSRSYGMQSFSFISYLVHTWYVAPTVLCSCGTPRLILGCVLKPLYGSKPAPWRKFSTVLRKRDLTLTVAEN